MLTPMFLLSRLFPRQPDPRPGEFYRAIYSSETNVVDPFSPRYEVAAVRDGWVKLTDGTTTQIGHFHYCYRLAPTP